MSVGRPPKYTRRTLKAAVDKYFRSISYTTSVLNRDGTPVLNDDGEEIRLKRYAASPGICALCLYLGIDRSTWENYADISLHPEMRDIVEDVRTRIEAYLDGELCSREKNVQGIIFNLQNNYGWKQKQELELGMETRRTMASEGVSIKEKLALISAERAARAACAADEDGEEA